MEAKDYDKTLDLTKIKPYGDTMNDGKTQLSFTLPVPAGDEAIEAAKQRINAHADLEDIMRLLILTLKES